MESRTTPRDFFLWAGAMIALYLSVVSFIALLFEYINYAYPDPNTFADPYSSAMRLSMASLIVLVPTTLALLRIIRSTILKEAGKARIWVRRWVLVLTLFVTAATMLIDLITLVNYFLNGEVTMRFILKVATVLLAAGFVFMHFFADLKGYWLAHPRKADAIGIAIGILALAAIAAGFLVIGSPAKARDMRLDIRRVEDLQGIQSQIVSYYQAKRALPASIGDIADPLSYYALPKDPATGTNYSYEKTGALSFRLCADFALAGREAAVRTAPAAPGYISENWQHDAGRGCFDRTVDPERYPPLAK